MQEPQRKRKVILADDTAETRRNTHIMLSMIDEIEVVAVALDGKEAIEMAHKHKPDIVVFDLHMPKVDGFEAYRQISKENPRVAGIVISVYKDPSAVKTALSLGIQHYLNKPFTSEELEKAIKEILNTLDPEPNVEDPSAKDILALRQLADEYIQKKRTDEEAVKVFEKLLSLPDCELRWVQTLAMIYVIRQRWDKLQSLGTIMKQRTRKY
jgi:YesN/AraC family two-component response regulator